MGRVFTIGEALIDFIPLESKGSLKDVDIYIKMAGGAPANVAVAASKLGSEAHFIGMVGKDSFGEFLLERLQAYGVDTSYTFFTNKAKTGISFVSLGADGSRDFSFYGDPRADLLLEGEYIKNLELNKDDFVNFGSIDLMPFPVKYATISLLEKAKNVGATVVFDTNVRAHLWDDKKQYRNTILKFIKYSDILKVSDEEIEFITGQKTIKDGVTFLKSNGANNIIVTLGKNGANAHFGNINIHEPAFRTNVVDTTGAGDSFVGAVLNNLDTLGKKVEDLSENEVRAMLVFANKVGAITSSRRGAMDSLPTRNEVMQSNM